jgi:Flp pilus assembly protein TadG
MRRRDEGATAVEVAIVLPVVLAFVGMILFGALYGLFSSTTDNVARRAARYATTRTGSSASAPYPTAAQVSSFVAGRTPGFMGTPQVATTSTGTDEGSIVTVSVTFPEMPELRAVGSFMALVGVDVRSASTISRSASGRRE